VDTVAEEAAMKAEAEKLRREAVAGGDFEKLEVEAYAVAHEDDSPLDPALGKVTRAKLGRFQELIFDELRPGQVSELVSSEDFWVIFKVVSKEIMPRDEAKMYLSQQRLKEALDSLRDSVKPRFDDSFFNAPPIAKGPEPVAAKGSLPDNKSGSASVRVSSMGPDESVITMEGMCDDIPWSIAKPVGKSKATDSRSSGSATSQGRDAGCKTVISRAAFEKLAGEVAPGQPPQANLQFAHLYSEQLIFAHRAHELGLDKGAGFAEIMKFTNLQLLSRTMSNYLQGQAENMPEGEFEKYYKEHPKEFEQVELLQLTVPKRKEQSSESESSAPAARVDTVAEEAAMKAEAEKLRREAVAGGDFEKLEVEAYTVAGNPDFGPDPAVGKVTRATARQFQGLIFDELQPGQVSEVVPYQDFWLIFKVVSKEIMPRDEAKMFTGPWTKEAADSLKNSVKSEFNDAYFNATPVAQPTTPGQQ
jgi:parvulin-like peptidyl-prolyl isomerase